MFTLTHLFQPVAISPVLGPGRKGCRVPPVFSPCYKAVESTAALGEMGEQYILPVPL